MSKPYEFSVSGITCTVCTDAIENVKSVTIDKQKIPLEIALIDPLGITPIALVTTPDTGLSDDIINEHIIRAIDEVGFAFKAIAPESDDNTTADNSYEETNENNRAELNSTMRNHIIKGICGILAGSIVLGFCISGITIPLYATHALYAASTLLTLYLGKETYYEAFTEFTRHRRLSMDTLFSASTLIAISTSIASLFIPSLPMMFDTALLIFGFSHLGKALKDYSKITVDKKLTYRSLAKSIVVRYDPHTKIKSPVPTKTIVRGDTVIISSGETVPTDGICLNNQSAVCTINFTGTGHSTDITKGTPILAGSTVPTHISELKMQVTAPEKKSHLAKLDEQLKNANCKKAPLVEHANNIIQWLIPAILVIAGVSAVIMGTLFTPLSALQCATAILASACPCTFGMIVPLGFKIGITKAFHDGILFTSDKAIETAAQVDVVVLDLTGTLTTGELRVTRNTVNPELLSYLAAIEKKSEHAFAQAIFKSIDKDNINKNIINAEFAIDTTNHSGLKATIDNTSYMVGNINMMKSHNVEIPPDIKHEIEEQIPEHVIYFTQKIGERYIYQGYILLNDELRPDAKQFINDLQQMKKEIHICTGTDQTVAEKYARRLKIPLENVIGNCPPGSDANGKANYITKLKNKLKPNQKNYVVAMIGDAANDAPAIKISDLGVAVQSNASSELTRQHAGAFILKDNELLLHRVTKAFTIPNQAVRNINQNIYISLAYNALSVVGICCLFGMGCMISPAIGAAVMILQTLFVLGNSARFYLQKNAPVNDHSFTEDEPQIESTHSRVGRELSLIPAPQVKIESEITPLSHSALLWERGGGEGLNTARTNLVRADNQHPHPYPSPTEKHCGRGEYIPNTRVNPAPRLG